MQAYRAWFRQLWREQPGLHRGFLMDVATALTLGILTFVGGRERTTGPAWDTLNTSGGPLVWGAVLIVLACALVAATFWRPAAVLAALIALAVVYGLVGWWFLVSALPGGSSFWGTVLCARAMGMHLSRAWAYYEGAQWRGT